MQVSKSNSTNNFRLHSVDICRGLALFLMVEAHITHSLGQELSNILAAPFFLIVSGLSYDLFLSSRLQKKERQHVFYESVIRGILIYAVPLIPYYILSISGRYEIYIFHWGVFQIIGVGYLIGMLVPNDLNSKVIIIFSIFVSTYAINIFQIESLYFLLEDKFPILPWFAYFFVGRAIYKINKIDFLNKDANLIAFNISTIVISILLVLESNIAFSSETRDTIPIFMLISSFQVLILSLMMIFIDRKNINTFIFDSFKSLGKICFSGYYIHFLFLSLANKFVYQLLDWQISYHSALLVLTLVVGSLALIEKIWRRYDYRYSLEWIVRKGAIQFIPII